MYKKIGQDENLEEYVLEWLGELDNKIANGTPTDKLIAEDLARSILKTYGIEYDKKEVLE